MAVSGGETRSLCPSTAVSTDALPESPNLNASPPLYSEIPGTVPLNHGQDNNIPPPSYDEVIDPEASPPTYQSLFGQVREARKNSNGFVDFLRKVIILLLGTIGCSIILAITIVVPVSMILVGSKYFGECPVEQFIPVYLIVGGTFGVLKNLLSFFSRLKKNDSEQERLIHRSRDSILNCFLIAWFITGCIWTYKVYEPEYEDESSPFYCNKTLYLFAFWLVTSSFILVGVLSIFIMCFVVSSVVTANLSSVITTAVFMLTFVLVGLPIWWKTTEVYRYTIPHDKCQELVNLNVRHTVPVNLIVADRSVEQSLLWEKLLLLSAEFDSGHTQPQFAFHWTLRTVTQDEEHLISAQKHISDLDSDLHRMNVSSYFRSSGEIRILILNQTFLQDGKFIIGKHEFGYILNNADADSLADDVFSLVQKMVQVSRLQKLYVPPSTYTGDQKPDRDRMRHLRSASDFDVIFSLFVSEPHVLDIEWNIENSVNVYLQPFLAELDPVYKINIKSQVLYMTSLPLPKRMNTDENGELIVSSDILPSIINSAEARLGSDTSLNPSLNFVIYVPTREQTPLRIYDSEGDAIKTNAFLLPQWGGFLFYNCLLPDNASLPHTVHLDERAVMEVFLSQFRLLLGLPEICTSKDESCQVLPNTVLSEWELDFLLRKNIQEYLSAAASSLSSLSFLLHSIGNIVIRDDVGEKIYKSVSDSHASLDLLSGGDLYAGFLSAKSAFITSDEAFFDPSLLALLYFPEDQKYAIYIPLFLPISIPVITSLTRLWKFWKENKKKSKKD